ncbi:ATP-binding cassette domain-containing protein [Eggerthellaceae bacterium zg-1084]|uniref:energy-coupling factor transporter ATPase n=1 Tax=Berryella wangjianweii TaxID=2734634 RepID=UPI001553F8A8|nr:energy-coupling factor transporter ATPase [Berryella wangjianweii]NPD31107.1 ATP-binding cassette domain-containing protein [Berryella wangjianweii]
MPVVFDRVSFAYHTPADQRKAKKGLVARIRERRTEVAGADSDAPQSEDPRATGQERTRPAWGVSAHDEWALRDVSFTLADGEFLGLAGHTGSGKSTLIQHMNGLLSPTEGRVTVDGRDLADKAAARDCRGFVGVVFQYPERQLFAETVLDDVAFGPKNLGLSDAEARERAEEALRSVDLRPEDIGGKSPFALSGGMQRRAALAGVIAMHPRVLVLDEPAAGLDPQAREELLRLIARLHASGMSVLMASHNMDDLARLCDRVMVLNRGRILMEGPPAVVFSQGDRLRAVGLDAPFAQNMAVRLRSRGLSVSDRLHSIQSLADELADLHRQAQGHESARSGEGAGDTAHA